MNESKSGDSSLHDWFSKSRSSDGKPGWVQLGGKYAGKPCAKQPGQTTKPKCGSSKMKRNLDADEEERAFRRKNREDPNPNRKGKAKNVATEEMNLDEKCWKGYTQKGMKKKGNKVVPNCVPVGEQVRPIGVSHPLKTPEQILQGIIDRDKSLGGGKVEKYGLKKANEEVENIEEKNWIQGAIKKPGALKKELGVPEDKKIPADKLKAAAKKGGKEGQRARLAITLKGLNKEETEIDEATYPSDFRNPDGSKRAVAKKKYGRPQQHDQKTDKYGRRKTVDEGMELQEKEGKKDACYKKVKSRYSVWPSAYASGALVKCRKVGAANWGNSTKKEEFALEAKNVHGEIEVPSSGLEKLVKKAIKRIDTDVDGDVEHNDKHKGEYGEFVPTGGDPRKAQGRQFTSLKTVQEVFDEMYQGAPPPRKPPIIAPGMPKVPFIDLDTPVDKQRRLERHVRKSEYLDAKTATKKPTQVAHYEPEGEMVDEGLGLRIARTIDKTKPPVGRPSKRRAVSTALKMREVMKSREKNKNRKFSGKAAVEESAAWTRKAGKNKEGGLNEKGRKSYERENPGSDLKAPSKKVGNPRRASFCARMKGMKKKLTSSKTANDPNSRINKSLRAWNC